MRTQQEQLTELYQRVTALELAADQPRKPWFLMKGVMGPLASGAATVALVVGYIANWPADAMAIIAAIAGGGSITGIIGRMQREAQPVKPGARRGGAVVGVMGLAVVAFVALQLIPAPAAAMDRTRPCLLPDGRTIEVPKSSCRMYHETTQVQSSNTTYAKIAENIELTQPGDCNPQWEIEKYALCMMREQSHARDVVELANAMGSPLDAQDRREQRAYQERRDKRQMVLQWATFGLNTYVALDGPRNTGSSGGDTYIAGDNFDVRGGGPGDYSDGSAGAGVSVSKVGDNNLQYAHKGSRPQQGLAGASLTQDNRSEQGGTEFYPGAAEGSSASYDPSIDSTTDDRDTFGLGEIF